MASRQTAESKTDRLHEIAGAVLAFGMAGTTGMNTAPAGGTPDTAHLQAVMLALGQMFVVLAFIGVTVYLLATKQPVDAQLWTLDVSLVSFYIGQRVNIINKPGP